MTTTYSNVSFNDLTTKRRETVRNKIAEMWADGYTSEEISKRVRVSKNSVSALMGNLTRQHLAPNSNPNTRSRR